MSVIKRFHLYWSVWSFWCFTWGPSSLWAELEPQIAVFAPLWPKLEILKKIHVHHCHSSSPFGKKYMGFILSVSWIRAADMQTNIHANKPTYIQTNKQNCLLLSWTSCIIAGPGENHIWSSVFKDRTLLFFSQAGPWPVWDCMLPLCLNVCLCTISTQVLYQWLDFLN